MRIEGPQNYILSVVGFMCHKKNTTEPCGAVVFSREGVFQGYRYWAGIGVLQSCESALTHYRLVANHGTYFNFLFHPLGKKMQLILNTYWLQ